MEIPIQVAVRIKPLTNVNDIVCTHSIPFTNSIQVGNQHNFPVNYALPTDCSQSYIFLTTVCPLINCLLEGCDVSIVAVGQGNSGKSYTLLGPGLHCAYSESEHGIIPRFIRELFTRLSQNDRNTNISITWTQICGENIQDLLGNGSVEVCDVSDAFHWLQLGMSNMAPKNAHTLFTITIEQQWNIDSGIEHRISTASFADLSSCENVIIFDQLGARSISNDSGLINLYGIINHLADFNFYPGSVPYNQSTLTTLLKDSFGGRAKTVVVCCVSPLVRDYSDTLNMLQLCLKIQCIKNYVTTNSYTNYNVNTTENNSEHGSVYSDMFGLQFAVSQWSKLVSNAENLFSKLLNTKQLSEQEIDQIGEWLLLKQECEDCFSSEETISIENLEPQRSLGRIEEENEIDNETSDSSSPLQNDLTESETESDIDPQKPEFLNKLDSFMQTFRLDTDHLVSEHLEIDLVNEYNPIKLLKTNRHLDDQEQEETKNIQKCRRKSIHPGEPLLPEIYNLTNPEINFLSSDFDKINLQEIVPLKTDSLDPSKQLKNLTINTEMKQKKIRQIIADLEGAQKQVDELQYTIQIKEQLIENMIRNGDTRSYAKQKFQKKRTKLQSEYYKARTQLAQAENNYLHYNKPEFKEEIEKYRSIAAYYEKRLRDIEHIKIITEESARKVIELQNSLHTSRKQLERLKKQLRKEEKRKDLLEQQLIEDKLKLTELETQQSTNDTILDKQIELDHIFKDPNTSESLRHEIRNLRRTRDCLVEQRCHLDLKFKKEKMLSDTEERKLLECEEAIEAIDAAIEYKNELICGRKQLDSARIEREKGEELLMQRLLNLSENELRTLLYKYFQKVIDLRDSSKKLETQLLQVERDFETNSWRVQTLSHLLQQVRLESERRIVLLQQQHEDKLNLMMRHFADETSASSDPDSGKFDRVISKILDRSHGSHQICQIAGTSRQTDNNVAKYSEESRDKNKLLAKFQELTRYHSEKRRVTTVIPQQNLRQLQSNSETPATKVTRQKNKLIIQQSKIKK